MTSETGIRPYGPGKFDNMVDAFVYNVAQFDEDCGDVNENGWYGLLKDGASLEDGFQDLTTDEQALLRESVGIILSEDSQGFVSVTYYSDSDELNKAWAAILNDQEAFNDEHAEPQEEDITATDSNGPFFYLRKQIASNPAELKAWMAQQNYWPDVWVISDHGNAHRITLDD